MRRALFIASGWLMVGLGAIGAFVPLMPSSIFLLAAVWFFARSSPRLEAWVLNHPHFGPPLRLWIEHRAITRRMKISAGIAMVIGYAIFVVAVRPEAILAIGVAAFFALCATIIFRWTEPVESERA